MVETNLTASGSRGFNLMAKPAGPRCPLRCSYCFYTEKQEMLGRESQFRMSEATLESYIRKYIAGSPGTEVYFAWQGGEPTLMGLDFFRRAVALQKRYAQGKTIHNALQTSGVLIDGGWCRFLRNESFLVGLGLDGPREIHDRYRVGRNGAPTFDRVMTTLKMMREEGVQFNTLTAVTREGAAYPEEIYDFLDDSGSRYMQFIPIVERIADENERSMGLSLALHGADRANSSPVMPWSVTPGGYGDFLIALFNRWVKRDVGRLFVQIFDSALAAWMGLESPLCLFSETCGNALVIEHNGDVYSCDHFVYPEHLVGNIEVDDIGTILHHPRLLELGQGKRDALPRMCRDCDVLFACRGGCPKNRFTETKDGEPGLNYLCWAYRRFFRHINPAMGVMSDLLKQGRPAADIMRGFRSKTAGVSLEAPDRVSSRQVPGRNQPCPCGSGRKFKKCCGV